MNSARIQRLARVGLGVAVVVGGLPALGAAGSHPALYAQYKAPRQYMNRIAPQLPPPPSRPATAAPPLSPAPPALPAATAAQTEKARAEKDAVLKRTIDFQKQRAEAGSVSAQYDLGKRYMTGDGLDKDLGQARKWFEAAAKQGHEGAAAKLQEIKKLPPEVVSPAGVVSAGANKPTVTGDTQTVGGDKKENPPTK